MPRVIRDSDEDVETKSSGRRTRASSAASSAASVTDSPARRTTRRNKQLTVIESSPESLNDSNNQPVGRKTRSRAATLDKSTAVAVGKTLRSRKNSASSNQSETIDLESETTKKRVTRKAAATAAASGTPTKTNPRTRNLRAGSEAKSTPPPTRSTRVTRASSVDPLNTPNESVGTPVKKRTRASIVPAQQTVEEEQEAQTKTPESLNKTVVEIDGDSENESVSTRGESSKKPSKNSNEVEKDSSVEQSNLGTSKMNEENMTDKSRTSTDSNGDSTLNEITSHSITPKLDSFTSRKKENSEKIDPKPISDSLNLSTDQNLTKANVSHSNSSKSNSVKSKVDNNDECEHIDVEDFTLTDDSIDVVNSPKTVEIQGTLASDIKDSYVKLNRTNLVENLVSDKLEENKNNDNLPVKLKDSDSVSQSNVITNAKTAIVLVNDFVKSKEYFGNMKDQQIFDSGISLNNKDDVNCNTSVHNSDDQMSMVSIEDSDEVLSLKLSSPSRKETQNGELIVEVLPDDEKNYLNEVTDEFTSVNVNTDSAHNFNSDKPDDCLKENVVPESELEAKSLIVINEKNNEIESSGAENLVHSNTVKIADENGDDLIHENSNKVDSVDSFEMINASGKSVNSSNLVHEIASHDDSVEINEGKDDTKINEVAETSEIETVGASSTKSKVDSDENIISEKSDSVNMNNSVEAECNDRVTDNNEQPELMNTSESNTKDNRDIRSPCVFNESSSNRIEPKVSLEDKNSVPSAVTDADGDNASSPFKGEETHETSTDISSTKSPEKSKRKSKARVIDSDLDESAENLFQDIPAEEWSNGSKKIDEVENSFNKDTSVVEESRNGEDDICKINKSRKSQDKNELDQSVVEITNEANETGNQEADLSLSKKARKSIERKRESGQSSDSGIQDGNKTIVEIDVDENESRRKGQRLLDHSLKANQSLPAQDGNDSTSEKLSKSLVDRKSLNKSRKSLGDSCQFNVSVFDKFRKKNDSLSENTSATLNTSNASRKQSLNNTRKSTAEEKTLDENSETEAMEVDEDDNSENEMNNANNASNKSRKSFNKSQIDQSPTKNDSIAEKSSVSLNSSKIGKRLSLDKSMNKSSLKSLSEIQEEEASLSQNESPSKNLSTSLNESKKYKNRLSEKFDELTRRSLVAEQSEEEESEGEEMEVDVVSEKSPNKSRKSLNESSSNKSLKQKESKSINGEAEITSKSQDVKSPNVSDVVIDGDSESETEEPSKNDEKKNKSIHKSRKSVSKSPDKMSTVKDVDSSDESIAEGSPKKKKVQESESVSSPLDRSLQKNIERMKFANPPKHNLSTVAQVNSSSEDDSDDSHIPNFMFKLSDENFSDEEEKEESDMDSDVEREYNLGGKSISKYSDDDVPGDDCRVSEDESSENEDDGEDLQDFVVPDEEVDDEDEEGEDESDDDDGDGDDNDEDENEDEDEDEDDENEAAEVEDSKEKKLDISKKNVSFNNSQSTVKNRSAHLRKSGFSQSSGSESDDEATEAENKNSKERFDLVDDSKKLAQDSEASMEQTTKLLSTIKAQNASLQKKDKSMNESSKSAKSNVSSSSESDNESTLDENRTKAKEKSTNISAKNKSLNSSKPMEDQSTVISNSVSKSGNSKILRIVDSDQTESSSSESDKSNDDGDANKQNKNESVQIASPSETESEEEEGEDYYRIVSAGSRNASLIQVKKKKLIDCSTPKAGAAKKTDFSKDNLSITASRRKSGSLNDLTDSKIMSSRLSIGDAASKSMKLGDTSMKLKDDVEIVATPDTVTKTRQAWKLIPLNHTAHPAVEDTPGTKFLKKAKLNDSFPVLDSMKSNDLGSAVKKGKKVTLKEPQMQELLPKEDKKSKKRKLLDMSSAQSVDEDSILRVSKKNKKRARIDEQDEGEGEKETDAVEEVPKSKKKKTPKAEKVEVDEAPEDVEKPKRKRKEKLVKAEEAEEEDQNVEQEKRKKKKSKVFEDEPVKNQKSKNKGKKHAVDNSGDGAPENGFEEPTKESLKNKRKNQVDGIQKDKQRKSLKRLPEDVLEDLTDEPLRRPDKRQKLSRNKERSVIMPSKSMFSPGKSTKENLRVDDGYVPLSSTGGTTQFAVVNLQKAKKVTKKSAVALTFRDKMIARNMRMPTAMYLAYMKKQKVKGKL